MRKDHELLVSEMQNNWESHATHTQNLLGCAVLKYKRFKLKLRVFLAGHSVAIVTYCVTKIAPTCSPVIGQFFNTMIVASFDNDW